MLRLLFLFVIAVGLLGNVEGTLQRILRPGLTGVSTNRHRFRRFSIGRRVYEQVKGGTEIAEKKAHTGPGKGGKPSFNTYGMVAAAWLTAYLAGLASGHMAKELDEDSSVLNTNDAGTTQEAGTGTGGEQDDQAWRVEMRKYYPDERSGSTANNPGTTKEAGTGTESEASHAYQEYAKFVPVF